MHDVLARVYLARLCFILSRARVLDGEYLNTGIYKSKTHAFPTLMCDFKFTCRKRRFEVAVSNYFVPTASRP